MTSAVPPVSLGIIGCGRVTQTLHLPTLRNARAIRVLALADTDRAQLNRAADRFGIPNRYTEAEELWANSDLDTIAICTPAASHPELALAAIAAGKHIFVEKPLALNPDDGERMLRAAESSGKVHAVGFNLRCHRLVRRAREVIGAGSLGQIHQIITVWGSSMQHEPEMPAWRRVHGSGGGALSELGVHHLDLCPFLLGDPITSVHMLSRSGACENESVSLLAQTLGNVLISSSFSQVTTPTNEVLVVGDKGALSFSLYRSDSFSVAMLSQEQYGWRGRLRRVKRWREFPAWVRAARGGGDYFLSYGEQWRRFAMAIRGEGAPAGTFADGLVAQRIIDAAVRSQTTGQRALVDQVA